jgi:hypothetical protein
MAEISFFGEVDRDRDGRVVSSRPAYLLHRNVEKLENDVRQWEHMIKTGVVPEENKAELLQEINSNKEQIDKIMAGRPKMNGAQESFYAKEMKEMAERIRESMFGREEMRTGLRTHDDFEELQREHEPCVEINPDVAAAMGYDLTGAPKRNGNPLVSRAKLVRAWQTVSGYFDSNTHTESLRPD